MSTVLLASVSAVCLLCGRFSLVFAFALLWAGDFLVYCFVFDVMYPASLQ